MDAYTGFQQALDLIELNLDGEISLESAACAAGMTVYHFQKMFSMLTGMTVGEYVRARRLTLAAASCSGVTAFSLFSPIISSKRTGVSQSPGRG